MNDKAGKPSSVSKEFNAVSLLWRFVAALALVLATYNPSDLSFFHWVRAAISDDALGPQHFFVGVVIFIGWSIFLIATFHALGKFGMLLAAAFFGTLIWLLTDWGFLEADTMSAITWISLVCLAGLLTVGLSWAHIWRRMTGQFDTEDSAP